MTQDFNIHNKHLSLRPRLMLQKNTNKYVVALSNGRRKNGLKNRIQSWIQSFPSTKATGIRINEIKISNVAENLVLSSLVLFSTLLQQWESVKDSRLDPVLGLGRADPGQRHSHYLPKHDVMKDRHTLGRTCSCSERAHLCCPPHSFLLDPNDAQTPEPGLWAPLWSFPPPPNRQRNTVLRGNNTAGLEVMWWTIILEKQRGEETN